MENILKKPYEISLWDDNLYWEKLLLEKVDVEKSNYEPGLYYSASSSEGQAGAANYTLDTDAWSDDKVYFQFDGKNLVEGDSVDSLSTDPLTHQDWYDFNITKDTEKDDNKIYYQHNDQTGRYEKAEGDFNTSLFEAQIKPVAIVQYYKERKICVIGSNTMNTPIRAIAGKLVSNINGSNTLTFNMYSKYYDEEAKTFYDNPFLKLLVNERKVKLRHGAPGEKDTRWYDFIIKDVKENSENKTFSYTCKDLFINELSKSGFNIQLDPELENNMGNVTTLAKTVLQESDWEVWENDTIIQQTKEEPLYAIKLKERIVAKDMQNKDVEVPIETKNDKDEDNIIYGFYSVIANQEPYFQFVYREDGKYEVDDDRVITNGTNYFIEDISYTEDGLPAFASHMEISSIYRGDKLIRQAITKFDSTVDKYVNIYYKQLEDGSFEIDEYGSGNPLEYYGYTETEYITPTAVSNFITNGEGFTSETGWKAGPYYLDPNRVYPDLDLISYPDFRQIGSDFDPDMEFRSFLKFKRTKEEQVLYNSGFSDHRSAIKTLTRNEEYVLRAKIFSPEIYNDNGEEIVTKVVDYTGNEIDVIIGEYKISDQGEYQIEVPYFSGKFYQKNDGWFYAYEDSETSETSDKQTLTSLVEKSYTDLINKQIGIFFKTPIDTQVCFEKIEFFKYLTYQEEDTQKTIMVVPGAELFSYAKTKYKYYLPNSSYKSEDDISFVYDNYEPSSSFIKQYNENNFEKIRSITASESNRFNMVQDLCETFECWAKFTIEHDEQTGEILLGKDKNWGENDCPQQERYRQQKWISFHEYIGQDNHSGFRYGVNLKSISRTLNSDGIVSKIIVKNNANEFAPNGFCSIARATENPTGENFIYNFNYYIQQDLVSFSEINNDLYSEHNGYIGYYKKLKRLNNERESYVELQSQLLNDISQYSANYQTYKLSVDNAKSQLNDADQAFYDFTGYTFNEFCSILVQPGSAQYENVTALSKLEETTKRGTAVLQLTSLVSQHSKLRDIEYEIDKNGVVKGGRLYEAEQKFAEIEEYINELTSLKRALNLQFYKKYSRFIQEGSWISEDYVDENLYYLDAESTLYTSSQPKVTYTINVLELSQLEGYENYRFALGDKTYIEDTEFFGWVWSENGVKSPYHEEVVVFESTVELDSPEKNSFKIQNFKTQFEDLFQRITATTQSVEYHTGEYGRATSVVQTDGTINIDTLQSSFDNNAIRLENAKDQSVRWDETGITTISLSKPSEVLRIVSGGVFISTDNGSTWHTGITGSGINANFITTGQLNTSAVNIMSGDFPSFRWDTSGISAFAYVVDGMTDKPSQFNASQFVRFDQYGIYGINGYYGFDPNKVQRDEGPLTPLGEDKIWANAKYALTWKGFMLKNDDGSVQITSTDDIQVLNGDQERIKIGRLGENLYGIRISNADGAPVMETEDSGELWLKNKLKVGNEGSSSAEIGLLPNIRTEERDDGTISTHHEIIHAGNSESPWDTPFIVYEDGKVIANYIEANGGKIGNMTIESIENRGYELKIISNVGNSMLDGTLVELTATLYLGATPIVENVRYQWYSLDGDSKNIIVGANTNKLSRIINFDNDSFKQYGCEVTLD